MMDKHYQLSISKAPRDRCMHPGTRMLIRIFGELWSWRRKVRWDGRLFRFMAGKLKFTGGSGAFCGILDFQDCGFSSTEISTCVQDNEVSTAVAESLNYIPFPPPFLQDHILTFCFRNQTRTLGKRRNTSWRYSIWARSPRPLVRQVRSNVPFHPFSRRETWTNWNLGITMFTAQQALLLFGKLVIWLLKRDQKMAMMMTKKKMRIMRKERKKRNWSRRLLSWWK